MTVVALPQTFPDEDGNEGNDAPGAVPRVGSVSRGEMMVTVFLSVMMTLLAC